MSFATTGFESSRLSVSALMFDRDHSLWVGTTDQGIYRIRGSMVDHFDAAKGLSGDWVNDFFEDREGNIWVATTKGVDKFRATRVVSFSKSEGLSADSANSLLATGDGTTWVGNLGALDVIRDGKVSSIDRRRGLPGQAVTSLAEGKGGILWVGLDEKLFTYSRGRFAQVTHAGGGAAGTMEAMARDVDGSVWAAPISEVPELAHIVGSKVAEEIPLPPTLRIGSLATDPQGGVWAGLTNGDLAEYHDRHWRVVAMHRAVHEGSVYALTVSQSEGVYAATGLGMVVWRDGRSETLGTENGLPCRRIYSLLRDAQQTAWLYSECGLVSISDSELRRWWLHPDAKVQVQTFDALDGAQPMNPDFEPSASISPDGRLWFANAAVVQELNPLRLSKNTVLPPVHIEEIVADAKDYPVQNDLHLPALTRNLEIDYTALSFVVPQRVRFRYQLEGLQSDWQDADTRRQAFYTNLRPGSYRFHVIACNDDGLWNEVGDALSFTIAPAYYQTKWFEFLCAASFAGMLWLFYISRLKRATEQVQERLGARMEERERIARELHDTLLQGFQGLMLRLQAVLKTVPAEEPTHQMIESVLDRADQVLLEGRQSVRDLREEGAGGNELSGTLVRCGEELAEGKASLFSLSVVGTPQALGPIVFNEVYRIGREALINAFQHSHAAKIELELTYSDAQLCLRIRDDGAGINPDILGAGKPGHWGLSGMRERARKIGAQLNIWSKPGAGTELELTIPAKVAYPQEGKESFWGRMRGTLTKSTED
jgi:signal transduction histidine kinase